MSDFVSMLVDMGFEKERAIKALEVTGNRGVEPAMEWILANPSSAPSDATTTPPSDQPGGSSEPNNESSSSVPRSYKCDDCSKILPSMDHVELHSARTSHQNFSESTEEKKPLTEEEKQQQQKLLLQLLEKKRLERLEREKKDEIEKEKKRMESGKELAEAKRRLQEQEMKQIVEERRREKLEDKAARERIKKMIEADREARKAREAREGGSSAGEKVVEEKKKPEVKKEEVLAEKKEYTETKIQVRLQNGKSITQTFGVQEPLAAVRLWTELNRGETDSSPFTFMTTFPRRTFSEEDFETPLSALGLVPSAVVMVVGRK